jgi:hypothetical protein
MERAFKLAWYETQSRRVIAAALFAESGKIMRGFLDRPFRKPPLCPLAYTLP